MTDGYYPRRTVGAGAVKISYAPVGRILCEPYYDCWPIDRRPTHWIVSVYLFGFLLRRRRRWSRAWRAYWRTRPGN